MKVKGKGAVVVSAPVAPVVKGIAYGAGWVTVAAATCDPAQPLLCAHEWVATTLGGLALANVLHVAVYGRVFGAPKAIR